MPDTPFDDAAARRAFWWFMLLAFLVLAAGIGLRDPWPPDEPRFTLIARQMVESGQWLFPHRGMELYADKPPMLMWFEAVCFEIVRSWRVAFLLPSLLAGMGTLALVHDLGRRLWNPRTGLAAAFFLLCSLQFLAEVKQAQIDPLEMFWITLGNWGLLIHCLRGPNWRAFWLGCFAAGLGVITKGVGILVLLMLVPYALARLRGWDEVTRTQRAAWLWAGGALAFVLAVIVWLAPMLGVAYGVHSPEYMAYVRDILFHQTADRYAHSWAHAEPAWFFLKIMLTGWFPLSLLCLALLPTWYHALRARDARVAMLLGWWLLVLIFFSIPGGKRSVYILPVLPMVALAAAPYAHALWRMRWLQRLCFGLATLAGIIYVCGGIYALIARPRAARHVTAGYQMGAEAHWLWWIAIGVGVLLLASAAIWRARRGMMALLAGILAAKVLWVMATYPLLNGNQSTVDIMKQANHRIGANGQLALVQWREELLLQARRPVTEFGFSRSPETQLRDALTWQAHAPARRWILIDGTVMRPCVDPARAVKLGVANRVTWWMFRRTAVSAACRNGDVTVGQVP